MTLFENAMCYMTGESIDEYPEIQPTYECAMRILREFNISVVMEVKNHEKHGFYYLDADKISKIKNFFRKILDWFKKAIQWFTEKFSIAVNFVKRNEKVIKENMNKIPKGFEMKIHPDLINNDNVKKRREMSDMLDKLEDDEITVQEAKEKFNNIKNDINLELKTKPLTEDIINKSLQSVTRNMKKEIHVMKNSMQSSKRFIDDINRALNNKNWSEEYKKDYKEGIEMVKLIYGYNTLVYKANSGSFMNAFNIIKVVASGFKTKDNSEKKEDNK